ncbi:MAG: CPBP family intramembrane metalloprotease [Syntrophomonadaceae bacterium]|nr:CPBP family intramembrane metalloprotease [Syntrophomonadaceae bacterium]
MTKKVPWGIIDFIIIYVFSVIVSYLLIALWREPMSRALFMLGGVGGAAAEFFASYFIQFSVSLVIVFIVIIAFRKSAWHDLGFKAISVKDFLLYGIGGGIGILVLILPLSYLAQIIQPELEAQNIGKVLQSSVYYREIILTLGIGMVLAPVLEEILYRGVLYPVLKNYLGVRGGCILAGILFAAAHWDLWRSLPLAAGGMLLALLYEKTGSIWVPICAHGLWNAVASALVLRGGSLFS